MTYLMINVDEVNELREREKKLVEYLKKIEVWEAKMIETDECWGEDNLPKFTPELFDEWLELQHERNELIYNV